MTLVALYLFLPFFGFLIIGIPVAFSIGLASVIFLFFSGTPIPPVVLITEMYTGVNQFALLALPMFVLTGELLNRLEITQKLVDVAQLTVGWIKGGLAHVNILTSMFFAGISGSVLADTASIGPILIPAMIREKFPADFSAAVTAASSVIGGIIPPSVLMIIVGAQLQVSIGGLFAAGIVPGILIGGLLMVTAYIICARRGYGDVHRFQGVIPVFRASLSALPALLIPVWLLGGILSGVFTPTEAGAVAVFYTMLVGAFYYRTLNVHTRAESLVGAIRVTASAAIILATAIVFSRILVFYKVPTETLDLLISISENRVIIILIIVAFFLFVGTFMDAVANMIILGPLLMPIAVQGLGMHPIQYGLFLMVGLMLGLITPPLGVCLFIAAPIARTSLERVSIAIIPFLLVEVTVLLLIAFVPPITLFIPRLLGFV